jgi:hypothetical protein
MEAPSGGEGRVGGPRVAAARSQALAAAGARLIVATALFAATLAVGARSGAELGGFALGTLFVAFAARVDRRGVILRRERAPEPLPSHARVDPLWRVALEGLLPSSAGVTALTAIALGTHHVALSAILAGTVAGLGLAAALAWIEIAARESREGQRFYVERGRGARLFAAPMRGKAGPTA